MENFVATRITEAGGRVVTLIGDEASAGGATGGGARRRLVPGDACHAGLLSAQRETEAREQLAKRGIPTEGDALRAP